jgi:hypothetical protein
LLIFAARPRNTGDTADRVTPLALEFGGQYNRLRETVFRDDRAFVLPAFRFRRHIFRWLRRRIMKRLTSFPILISASAVMLYVAQIAAAADTTAQSKSAPLQVTVAPLAVSSAPPSVTFAPPRPAPASTPPATPKSEAPEVTIVAQVKDLLPTNGGYRRIVFEGQEFFCRNDLATGSHLERNPFCLTAAQWQRQQLRAQQWMSDVEHWAAADRPNPVNIGGVVR